MEKFLFGNCAESRTSFQEECHRAVVNEMHLHHRPENSGFHFWKLRAEFRDEVFVKRDGLFGTRGIHEIWAAAFAGVSIESELRDDEGGKRKVFRGEVHFPCVIREDSQLGALERQVARLIAGRSEMYADEQE